MTVPGIAERQRLINVAYRLLGSVSEAEDVVQEACARWYALTEAQRAGIDSPAAWLTTVAGRICLDLLRSARARRERYVGEWVPEPVPDGREWIGGTRPDDPAERVTVDESVTMALLVVLDAMTPAERVAFVLHDVFGYPFAEIAAIVGRTPAACRQLAVSARRRVGERPSVPAVRQGELVGRLRRAWQAKDVEALIGVLDPSVVAVADGGGIVAAALEPIVGGEQVARYLVAIPGVQTVLERGVNGQPGLVVLREGAVAAVFAFDFDQERITRIWAVRNPDKLGRWIADA